MIRNLSSKSKFPDNKIRQLLNWPLLAPEYFNFTTKVDHVSIDSLHKTNVHSAKKWDNL